MILWGAVVLVFSLAVCIMINLTGNLNWNLLWFGIIVVGWPLSAILLKDKCKSGGKSFISHTIGLKAFEDYVEALKSYLG